ncbi:MAG: CHRD domain-containing protein [Xanthomonadales bacterium]|nr:CHRD domain-containing protein [Xanthomonadales bacterium]
MKKIAPAALAAALISGPAVAGEFVSKTALSSAQEVENAVNDSAGRSTATIRFERDFSEARVRVTYRRLQGELTRLHLHCNIAGKNGPVAIGIVDRISAALDNSLNFTDNGFRINGFLTNVDFPENTCEDVIGRPVNNLVSLAAAIDEGLIYWNLHTDANPAGELRGQVRPLTTSDDD